MVITLLKVKKKKKSRSKKKKSSGNNSKDRPKRKRKQNSAPFNSTQFLMNDHSETNQYLDKKLNVNAAEDGAYNPEAGDIPKRRVSRARDSR